MWPELTLDTGDFQELQCDTKPCTYTGALDKVTTITVSMLPPPTCFQPQPLQAPAEIPQTVGGPMIVNFPAELQSWLGFSCEGDRSIADLLAGNVSDGEDGVITVEPEVVESLVNGGGAPQTWHHLPGESSDTATNYTSYDEDQNSSSDNDDDGSDSDASWGPSAAKRRCAATTPRRKAGPQAHGRRCSGRPGGREQRKKEQNKNAATRYREKKRAEEIENEIECEKLEKRNCELRGRVEDMTHEISVLRKLIIDIFRGPANAATLD